MEQTEENSFDLIYIRHAKSFANVQKHKGRSEGDKAKLKEISADSALIDSGVSPEGEEQIKQLAEQLISYNIKYVCISPLKRAVFTALEGLKNHPNFKEIQFLIMPCLKSKVQELMDIPSLSLDELLNEFSALYPDAHISIQFEDVEFCEHLKAIMDDPSNYHIHLLSEFAKKKLISALFDNRSSTPLDHFKTVSCSKAKKKFERSENVEKRLSFSREFIKEKLVPKISGDEKICIVSHSVIMSSLADGDSKEEKELTLRHACIAVGSSLDFKFIPVQQ